MTAFIGRLLSRLLCLLGAHRWSHPGGECECCGLHDDFFDDPKSSGEF